jgi:hypothetical protein
VSWIWHSQMLKCGATILHRFSASDKPGEHVTMDHQREREVAGRTRFGYRSREMWQIDDDLTAENYRGGGYCSAHLNIAR